MVELAIAYAAQRAAASGGAENIVVVGVVAAIVQIAVGVPGDDRFFSALEQLLNFCKAARIFVQPEWMVHEDESPTNGRMLLERLFHIFDLGVRDDGPFFARGIQGEKEHIFVVRLLDFN